MKERLEDLGRIYVMLGNVLEMELFDGWNTNLLPSRPKDMIDWFRALSEERQDDVLHRLAYQIQDAEHKLHEILFIARGDEEN